MDDNRNRNKMFADTNESGYVWTGPKTILVLCEEANLSLAKVCSVHPHLMRHDCILHHCCLLPIPTHVH